MKFKCNYISKTLNCNCKLTVGKIYDCEYDEFEMGIEF